MYLWKFLSVNGNQMLLQLTECHGDWDSNGTYRREQAANQPDDDGCNQSLDQEVRRYREIEHDQAETRAVERRHGVTGKEKPGQTSAQHAA